MATIQMPSTNDERIKIWYIYKMEYYLAIKITKCWTSCFKMDKPWKCTTVKEAGYKRPESICMKCKSTGKFTHTEYVNGFLESSRDRK
jgi:hypothetical protein